MRIVFRVDASASIGHGHVMRCITLADELRERGARVRFLCREEPGHAIALLEEKGYTVDALPWNIKRISPKEDAVASLNRIDHTADLLIVDHYALNAAWERKMRMRTRKIMAIDDLANRSHDCDLLLDQNLLPDGPTRYHGKVPEHCQLLLGPEYVLLDPAYKQTAQLCAVRKKLRRILVFFGGGDAGNMTCRALGELVGLDLVVDVVIGTAHPYPDDVRALCSANEWRLHVQTRRMPELIAQADLAVGAGGCSHWERAVLGLPSIVAAIAENQRETTRMLDAKGACRYLGPANALPEGAIRSAVESFRATPSSLTAMSQAAFDVLPDAKGCRRVAQAIVDDLQCAS